MIHPFLITDIAPFLALARDEGWLCDRWEFEFLLENFPEGCFVRREAGSAIGFITSAKYGKSGWIGNLLVHPDARRRGIGQEMMELAIAALKESGVETIWLTASVKGAGIYRRLGFVEIDQVNRWMGKGDAEEELGGHPEVLRFNLDVVTEIDRDGWGERRASLLRAAMERGSLYTSADGFVCWQPWEHGTQIGPWGCLVPSQASELLDHALGRAGEQVFLDVPAKNRTAVELLIKKGFTVKGSNLLMYHGAEPLYQPRNVFALASMGSMG